MPANGTDDDERAAAKVFGLLGALLVVAYPVYVYFGLTRFGTRALGLGLATVLGAGVLLRFTGRRRAHALVAARIPLTLLVVLLAGALFDDRRFVMALPVVTNVVFLAHFAASLRTMPVAERFARAQEDEVSPAQVAYCRTITVAWSAFFVVNGTICALLAFFAPVAWWTLYTGLLSYIALGAVFTIEYVVRKARFRKYGPAPIDRALARIFPPPHRPSEAPK
jgi:uncharacterized membrane protein